MRGLFVLLLAALAGEAIVSVGELDEEAYATSAIAGGRIFVRTRGALYCFGLSGVQ